MTETAPPSLFAEGRLRDDLVLLDVREPDEVAQGHIERALLVPRGLLEMRIDALVPDRDREIVVYCAGGARSALAAASLGRMGYARVKSLEGGFNAWKSAGLPFVMPPSVPAPATRYARHLRIPEVGEAGQARLLASKVLLVGAGGLGSPAALYLAAAGVGTLGIVDSDRVDLTNLQRQVLHRTRNVGLPKTASARETLYDLNPDVSVIGYQERLVPENVLAIVRGYDVVLDGSDNFATRYLVNDACLHLAVPGVHASVHRFDGQVTVFAPEGRPCYRCLFPAPLPAELAPSCEEAGVLGVLPGLMGLLQATETLKILLGIGRPLTGRLLTCDALEATFREFRIPALPGCPACGPHGRPESLLQASQGLPECPREGSSHP